MPQCITSEYFYFFAENYSSFSAVFRLSFCARGAFIASLRPLSLRGQGVGSAIHGQIAIFVCQTASFDLYFNTFCLILNLYYYNIIKS